MIRNATPADRPVLRSLQAYLPEATPCLLDGVGQVLVSVDATDTPVGYLLAVAGDGAHVVELVVAPDHRREGRATGLLCALLDAVDGPVTVATAPDNEAALSLYRSLGFSVVEELPDYYDSGPALLLSTSPDCERA
ncbi:MAG: GNAT family N-acetyltransferase [Haloferacaceae archaeon]